MKSLRSTGTWIALRASRRFFNEPRKNSASVSTESAEAPRLQGIAPVQRVEGIANHPARRRGGLEFSNDIQAIALESSRELRSGVAAFTPYFRAAFSKDRAMSTRARASRMRP